MAIVGPIGMAGSGGLPDELMVEAEQAINDKRFERAVDLLERVCEASPTVWEHWLKLSMTLASAERRKDADAIYRRAIQLFPQQIWLDIHKILNLMKMGDQNQAEKDAQNMALKFPSNWRSHELYASVAFECNKYYVALAEVVDAISLLCESNNAGAFDKKISELEKKRHLFAVYLNEENAISERSIDSDPEYFIAIISLNPSEPRTPESLARLSRSKAPVVPVQGVFGRHLPAAAIERLTSSEIESAPGKGSLGCTLGHIAALEALLQSSFDHALILEDDAYPMVHLPAKLSTLGIPKDYELCFVNQRAVMPAIDGGVFDGQFAHSVHLSDVVRHWPPRLTAPGADAYFITRSAAKKVIDRFKIDGFGHYYDWRLVGYSLPEGYPVDEHLPGCPAQMLRFLTDRRSNGLLKAYALFPYLFKNVASYSVIANEDAKL